MPAPRPSRAQPRKSTNPAHESVDADMDTEPEEDTPKIRRTMSKKRLSDVFGDQDNSFSSDPGRVPLKSVNINDDTAEKRMRRKSAKAAIHMKAPEGAHAGPSLEASGAEGGNGEASGASAQQAKQKQQLLSVAQAPVIDVPFDVMSSNFEEWMKMATDNKINAANSWNFALIDYFHDMSLLRNDTDNSINFQRASCTLDGCVKIWTSRVDSVGTETGKLLSNLANEGRADGDNEEGVDGENVDGQDPTQGQRKRKAHRAESTLAKSAAQLRNKKLDLEFTVDPLFRKTCADFDEGGAQGLLMNHLSLGVGSEGSLRVVFDASDSMGKGGTDEELWEEPEDEVDLSYLRKQFLPQLEDLEHKAISHSLESFSFSKNFSADGLTFYHDPHPTQDDDDEAEAFGVDTIGDEPGNMEVDTNNSHDPGVEDFFVGDQAVGDDYAAGDQEPRDDLDTSSQTDELTAPGDGNRRSNFVPFDPMRLPNERDLVMAMTGGDDGGGGLMMDYFDQTFLKNWAGPEHWKLRKVVRRPDPSEAAVPRAKREKKEAFKIDFFSATEKDPKAIAKELFVPVTRGAGITLPGPSSGRASARKGRGRKAKVSEKEKRHDQTLPDDMHFSSRQLVTLFLKPQFSLKMRGHRLHSARFNEGEIDENFWAQAAADQAAERVAADGDETTNGGAIPFNTQFFHDDYDEGPGFDDVFDGADADPGGNLEPGEQDLLAATQGHTRRVRPEFVNYAKRAKRVDVRKLKENIWQSLDIAVPNPQGEDAMDLDAPPITDPAEGREFTSVISNLQRSYPKDKMEEISTSFCFICLLHLANEQGLRLEGDGANALEVEQLEQKVGRIWDLRVFRDLDAAHMS